MTTNLDRKRRIERVLAFYSDTLEGYEHDPTRGPRVAVDPDHVTDLLADLFHFADHTDDISLSSMIRSAAMHFLVERRENRWHPGDEDLEILDSPTPEEYEWFLQQIS